MQTLERWGYRTVKTACSNLTAFDWSTRVMNGQTDRRTMAYTRYSIYAVAHNDKSSVVKSPVFRIQQSGSPSVRAVCIKMPLALKVWNKNTDLHTNTNYVCIIHWMSTKYKLLMHNMCKFLQTSSVWKPCSNKAIVDSRLRPQVCWHKGCKWKQEILYIVINLLSNYSWAGPIVSCHTCWRDPHVNTPGSPIPWPFLRLIPPCPF